MKILYRRELHKTTPTNFLYHVRLTYWLPLQLLWAGLYLNLKGTQMGSPPAEHGGVSSCRSSPVCFSLTLALSSIRAATQVILEVEGFGKTEYNLVKTLDDSLHKAETEASVWSSLRSEPLLPLRQDTAGWLELYRLFMDLPGGLSMSRGSSEREREREDGVIPPGRKSDTVNSTASTCSSRIGLNTSQQQLPLLYLNHFLLQVSEFMGTHRTLWYSWEFRWLVPSRRHSWPVL